MEESIPNARVVPSAAKPYAYPGSKVRRSVNGRTWILVLAIIQGGGSLMMYAAMRAFGNHLTLLIFVVNVMVSVGYLGLWLWARNSLFPALLTTLIVFATLLVAQSVVAPSLIFQGIVFKIVFIVGLSASLKKAYILRRQQESEAALQS